MRRAIGAIIATHPTIIASGTRASSTHHEVRAATVTTTAATSITPTNGIPLLKHIMGFSFQRLIDETIEEARGIQWRRNASHGKAGTARLIPGLTDERAALVV